MNNKIRVMYADGQSAEFVVPDNTIVEFGSDVNETEAVNGREVVVREEITNGTAFPTVEQALFNEIVGKTGYTIQLIVMDMVVTEVQNCVKVNLRINKGTGTSVFWAELSVFTE